MRHQDWIMMTKIKLNSATIEHVFLIESSSLEVGAKWRLNNGKIFYASMDDPEFLQKVDNGMLFDEGNRMYAKVEITQFEKNNKIQTQYRIVKILDKN